MVVWLNLWLLVFVILAFLIKLDVDSARRYTYCGVVQLQPAASVPFNVLICAKKKNRCNRFFFSQITKHFFHSIIPTRRTYIILRSSELRWFVIEFLTSRSRWVDTWYVINLAQLCDLIIIVITRPFVLIVFIDDIFAN